MFGSYDDDFLETGSEILSGEPVYFSHANKYIQRPAIPRRIFQQTWPASICTCPVFKLTITMVTTEKCSWMLENRVERAGCHGTLRDYGELMVSIYQDSY